MICAINLDDTKYTALSGLLGKSISNSNKGSKAVGSRKAGTLDSRPQNYTKLAVND